MKRYPLILLLVLYYANSFSQLNTEKAKEIIDAYTKDEKANGAVLVAQKGKVLFEEGYGYKNVASKTLNDVHTIFQIGSVTKQFTSAVILQLQQEKKLSVKDKLSKYFPDFPRGNDIVLENLLTHTSGLFNYTNNNKFMTEQSTKPHSQEEMMALFMNKPLGFEPGTKWEYSNSNYLLLGYIIEKVTGKTYEQSVRERIFQPLGMSSSGFDFTHLNSPDKATGYFGLKNPQPAPIVDSTASFSAGALYSTVEDLYKWDRGLYTNKILSSESKKQAFTPFKDKYGYGWFIDSMFHKITVSHGGGIFGFTSYILRFLDDETVVILLDNSSSAKLQDIAFRLAALVHNQPYELPKPIQEINVPASVLQNYVGEYVISPTFSITITLENGSLVAHPTGQGKFTLYAETETLFFLKVVDAKVEFKKDDNGVVTGIVLHQNGQDTPGKKK